MGTFLLLAIAAVLGSTSQLIGHIYLHLPETVVALFLFICLFILFEWWGKFFAPAGAIALVPMIISPQGLIGYPLQVMIGAALLIFIAMVLFLKCYKWPKSHLIYCLVPAPIRTSHRYRSYLRQQDNEEENDGKNEITNTARAHNVKESCAGWRGSFRGEGFEAESDLRTRPGAVKGCGEEAHRRQKKKKKR